MTEDTTRTDDADGTDETGTERARRRPGVGVSRRSFLRAGAAGAVGAAILGPSGTVAIDTTNASDETDATDGTLFHVDFEDASTGPYEPDRRAWGGNDLSIVADEYLSVVESEAGRELEARFPEGVDGAGNGNGGGDFIVDLGEGPDGGPFEELHCAYRIRFDEGFEFHQPGGKLPGLAGTDGTDRSITGGDDPDGENGWSARMMWRDPSNPADGGLVMFYTYHPDMPDDYGENMYWDHGPSGQVHFQPGRWHRIEHRVVMNTPGEHDGILEGWFDGEKAFEHHDLRFRDVPDLGIDDFYFSLFFGGGQTDHWAHDREEQITFDDVVVSTDPIWLGDDDPPAVPTGLEASNVDETTIELSWKAVEDVGSSGLEGYRISQNGRFRETVSASETVTTVDRVIAGETHEFGVSAVDTAGNESEPTTVAVTTDPIDDPTGPPAPDGLHPTARQLEWVEVAWSPVDDDGSGLAGYDVFVDGTLERRVGPETTSTRLADLASGTSYEVGVAAVDLAGNDSDPTTAPVRTVAGVGEADDALVVHDFGSWPGENALGEWAGGGDFENGDGSGDEGSDDGDASDTGEVVDGALVLEYDDGGWLRSYVERDVSEYDQLSFLVSGERGGEEHHVVCTLEDVSDRLAALSDDSITTGLAAVRIDLEEAGVPAAPSDIHLDFGEGGAGTLEIHEIRFDYEETPAGVGDPVTTPAPPSALRVANRTTSSVTLEWEAPDGDESGDPTYVVSVDGSAEAVVAEMETTIEGLAVGTTFEVGVATVGADGNESSVVTTEASTQSAPPELGSSRPQDTTGDGRSDDVTGDGETTPNDVVVFFDHVDESVVTDYPEYYDFDGNGEVSTTDVVELFESL